MKQRQLWLFVALSLACLIATATVAAAEMQTSGTVEVGVAGMDISDSPARVNEYVGTRSEEGFSFAPKLSVDSVGDNSALSLDVDIMGPRDQKYRLDVDAERVLRLKADYQVLEYWKDRETLDQMGATGRGDTGGSQPSTTTDKIFAELIEAELPASVGGGTINYDPREAHEQELSNTYIGTRREFKGDVGLTLPTMPNVSFHTGWRSETRQGMEQAIGVTKCDNCHVTASGKDINERTEELTFGATGRFGKLTMEYDYLQRTFTERADAPMRFYEDANNALAFGMLYENGDYYYARTPDSKKDSHSLKGRFDFTANTALSASYVKSDVESAKGFVEERDGYVFDGDSTLSTELESFGAKLSHRFANGLRFSVRGSTYEISTSHNNLYFPAREIAPDGPLPNDSVWPGEITDSWHSAAGREVRELGADLVYRLTTGTTVRFGYEYEEIDRDEVELGHTKTHTLKAALKSRINKNLSGRISYQYQNIDEPMAGSLVGIAQGIGTEDPLGSGLWYLDSADYATSGTGLGLTNGRVWYWTDVYPNRTLETTSQPEDVHEVKLSTTWSPKNNFAATLFARARYEENDRVKYEQSTFVPGLSLWYAPTAKMNLTMAYTFNKQKTENQMCVGWYHG
jgi:hypothetical protein